MHLLRKHLIGLVLLNGLAIVTFGQVNLSATWEIRYLATDETESATLELRDNWGDLTFTGPNSSGEGSFNGKKGRIQLLKEDNSSSRITFTYLEDYDLLVGMKKGTGAPVPLIASRPHQRSTAIQGTWYDATYDQFFITEQKNNRISGYYEPLNTHILGMIEGSEVNLSLSERKLGASIVAFLSIDGQELWVHAWGELSGSLHQVRKFKRVRGRQTAARPPGWLGARFNQSALKNGRAAQIVSNSNSPQAKGLCSDPRTMEVIDSWLALSLPFEAWSKARYDCWGRSAGIHPDGKIVAHEGPPLDLNDQTRAEYVLSRLHNTYSHELGYSLLQYVKFHLSN